MHPRPARRLGKRARILHLFLAIVLVAAVQLIAGVALTNGQTPTKTDPTLAAARHPGAYEAVHPTVRLPLTAAAFGLPLASANDLVVVDASSRQPIVTCSKIVGASPDELLITVGTALSTYSFSCNIPSPGHESTGA